MEAREADSFTTPGLAQRSSFFKKGCYDLFPIDIDFLVYKYRVDIVVKIEGMPPLEKTLQLRRQKLL